MLTSDTTANRDVFIRELLSNSNDALEKTRLLALTDSTLLATAPELNITVLADLERNRIIIRGNSSFLTALLSAQRRLHHRILIVLRYRYRSWNVKDQLDGESWNDREIRHF